MNSSQLHLPSSASEKAQLEYYGYSNYPSSVVGHGQQHGASQQHPQQQTGIPPNYPFYPAVIGGGGGQQSNCANGGGGGGGAQAPSSVPAASVSDLSQNPSQHQNGSSLQQWHCHNPFAPQPEQQRMKRPWWMWTIGVVDIIAAIVFTARVVQNVLTKDRFVADRDTLMWTFFLIFLSLAIQFLMGVGLLVGLRSTEDGTTFWYCQSWICGAYFLFGETSLLLLGTIVKLHSQGNEIASKLLLVVAKTAFRIVSFFLVKKFMTDLRGKPEYRLTMNAAEIEQYQQQRMLQIQQLQQHQDQQYQRQQQQQQQLLAQQLHQQQENNQQSLDIEERRQSVGGGGRLGGGRGSDVYYYVPPMSLMMSMMMNQDDGGTVPT